MDMQIKKTILLAKEYWMNQTKKTKTLIITIVVGVLLLSVGAPLLLRFNNERKYTILYQGLSIQEQNDILAVLYDMNQEVRFAADGTIQVPSTQVNQLKLQLSSMGYPKTALSYNVFTSNSGFMTTELEKKQYLIIDLQSRLEETLRQIDGVRRAIVTLNIPDDSTYVWQTAKAQGSASVMLELNAGRALDATQVLGIKNLVASAVPRMESSKVVVVNSATGAELSAEVAGSNLDKNFLQIEFEREVERKIEEKILNLLSMPYGLHNVRVSASVMIDYDKMLSEELQYIPNEDGKGVIEKLEEWYARNGNTTTPGAGEDSNTDIPIYQDGDEVDGVIEKSYSAEYLVSYIKRQIEKNSAELTSASVSVVINQYDLEDATIENWVRTISRAVNIDQEDVVVFSIGANQTVTPSPIPGFNIMDYMLYIYAGAGVLLLLLVVIIIVIVLKKRHKKNNEIDDAFAPLKNNPTSVVTQPIEVDPLKATLDNIQQFTKDHPEIAANLIKEMLKEDE